jgi:glycosyltransferase involved in cell wall biosynthesis
MTAHSQEIPLKLSIIIPTLNEERMIGASLMNLQRLTIPHETIVADDKSTDATVSIARQYADRVIECTTPERWTIATGRNIGAKDLTGDFLVFFDADTDIKDPNPFFERALKHFEDDPLLVGLTGKLKILPEYETLTDKIMFGIMNFAIRVSNNAFNRGQAFGKFQMVRTDAFRKIGGYNEKLVALEDADLFRRLGQVGRTAYDPELIIFHPGRRMHRLGWPRLIWQWLVNSIWVKLFGTVRSKEWTPIR